MKIQNLISSICGVILLAAPVLESLAKDDGDWRRGRIYYRTTCTACHKEMLGEGISPSSRTIAEWKAYFDTDRHDASGRTSPSLKYYVSREYRESIKHQNKVVKKWIDLKDDTLLQYIRAFVVHGAKDSDNPTRCK